MELVNATEQNVLTLLIWNKEFAKTLSLRLEAEVFGTTIYRSIARAALEHLKQYNEPPGTHIYDILENEKGERGKFIKITLDESQKLAKVLQPRFVMDELERFLQIRALGAVADRMLLALEAGDLEKAQEAVGALRTVPKPDEDLGIFLSDPDRALEWLNQPEEDYFATGIDALDVVGVRPSRGTMFLFIAPSGFGKTWLCVEVGKQGILHRHPTLHISLEMSEQEVAKRYVQSLFALRMHEANAHVSIIEKDMHNRGVRISFGQQSRERINDVQRRTLAAKLKALSSRPPLLIKDFPTATLTTNKLEDYLDRLDVERNFRPDLLILDYGDLMKLDVRETRLDTGRTFRELRGLAQRRNIALVVPTQGNRASSSAKNVKAAHVAEDWSKIATADTVCTGMRTPEEGKLNLARISVEKARTVQDGFQVTVAQSYSTGQFCIDSVRNDEKFQLEVERASKEDPDAD